MALFFWVAGWVARRSWNPFRLSSQNTIYCRDVSKTLRFSLSRFEHPAFLDSAFEKIYIKKKDKKAVKVFFWRQYYYNLLYNNYQQCTVWYTFYLDIHAWLLHPSTYVVQIFIFFQRSWKHSLWKISLFNKFGWQKGHIFIVFVGMVRASLSQLKC